MNFSFAINLLRDSGVADPARDVRVLFDWAFGQGASAGAQTRDSPNGVTLSKFQYAIDERSLRKPVSQIIGRRAFWRHDFEVTCDVLDPRPDTETLLAQALSRPFERVLDLGTGSGCILLSLLAESQAAQGVGVDISPAALLVAQRNAGNLDLTERVRFIESNWFDNIEGHFDLIVSNPPYISEAEMSELEPEVRLHEPAFALTDGADGLACYRLIAARLLYYLAPGGRVVMEIGPTQAIAVTSLLSAAGLDDLAVHRDLDGRDRCISGKKPTNA